eukprot:scaffold304392_cov21-Tisochrysis_lutea.AAC.1
MEGPACMLSLPVSNKVKAQSKGTLLSHLVQCNDTGILEWDSPAEWACTGVFPYKEDNGAVPGVACTLSLCPWCCACNVASEDLSVATLLFAQWTKSSSKSPCLPCPLFITLSSCASLPSRASLQPQCALKPQPVPSSAKFAYMGVINCFTNATSAACKGCTSV